MADLGYKEISIQNRRGGTCGKEEVPFIYLNKPWTSIFLVIVSQLKVDSAIYNRSPQITKF